MIGKEVEMRFPRTRAPAGHRLCKHLRCKEMYYEVPDIPHADAEPEPDGVEDGHVYWCLRTFLGLGPEGV